jgi:DNA-binding NarL/FixJ family response regulator
VLLADDHAIFRSGLRDLLSRQGFEVVGEAADGAEAVRLSETTPTDVVLMDLHMPRMTGVEATRAIAARASPPSVVVLTISADEGDVAEAVLAGASGYLLKNATLEQIVQGIRAAAAGESLISPAVAAQLLRRIRTAPGAALAAVSRDVELTERELEVLKLLAAGKDNAQIAQDLFLSEKTVKNHVSAILRKLQLQNRTEAAVFAVRSGLA